MTRYLYAILLLVFSVQASAQLYRWVDEKGRVHYGENPPQGVQKREVQGTTGAPSSRPAAPAARDTSKGPLYAPKGDPEAEAREKKARDEKRLREARATEERKPACAAAKDELAYAERNKLSHEKKGSRKPAIFTSEEQLAEIHKRRTQVNRTCY